MVMELTKTEFKEVRNMIIRMNNKSVTRSFNNLFEDTESKKIKVRGFVNPNNKNVIVDIPEELSYKLLTILVTNGGTIGNMVTEGVTLTGAPKAYSFIKSLLTEIGNCFKR